MAHHPPSGERRQISPLVELTPQNRPLAGRSSYDKRLEAFRAGRGPKPDVAPFVGLEGPVPYPIDIDLMFPPIEDERGSSLTGICVACALGGATVTALVAIAVFALTRPAAALTPAMLPRVPMEQDVTFGMIAFGISALFAFAVALYGILRRDSGAVIEVRGKKIPIAEFDPAECHLEARFQRPANGPAFGEDDRYA